MELYKYSMSKYLKERVFSPCRGKAEMIMRLTEIMAELCFTPESDNENADIVIAIGKIQRLFAISDNKIFSVQFPFKIQKAITKEMPNTFFLQKVEIDNYLLSRISTIFNDNFQQTEQDIYGLMESVLTEHSVAPNSGAQTYQEGVWEVLKGLLMMEEGYLRYDNDPANEDKELHPLHHIDVFYSPGCSFKIGLGEIIDHKILLDILDPKTKCRSINL